MHGFKRIMNGKEPAIDQPVVNGWKLSWNPDDGMYYCNGGEKKHPSFKEFRNAVYYAKTHKPPVFRLGGL